MINNDNKDIFNNTGLDVTYNEDNGTLESNKTCYSDDKYARSDSLLTHNELKNLGRIYNISIKGTKQDICSRLYNKALRFQDDVNKNYGDDLKQEKINKNSTCYQLKKKECNNFDNDCEYLNETKESLLERLMLLDLLTNNSQDYDQLLKSDIIEKLKEYSKDYDENQRFYKIQEKDIANFIKKNQNLLLRGFDSRDFNQALMDLGSTICKSKQPKCFSCPLEENCNKFITENNKNQQKFEGSFRQKRGLVLKILLSREKVTKQMIEEELKLNNEVAGEVLDSLVRDGLIEFSRNKFIVINDN